MKESALEKENARLKDIIARQQGMMVSPPVILDSDAAAAAKKATAAAHAEYRAIGFGFYRRSAGLEGR